MVNKRAVLSDRFIVPGRVDRLDGGAVFKELSLDGRKRLKICRGQSGKNLLLFHGNVEHFFAVLEVGRRDGDRLAHVALLCESHSIAF